MLARFERFSIAIFEISRCWHKLTADEMAKYGVKGAHAMYLLVLKRHGEGLTAAKLGELCARDKADVSRAVALMEEKGLVRRSEAAGTYRAKLTLTDAGREAAEHVCHRAALAVELGGKGFSEDDRTVFYQVLETICTNLQELTKEGLPN